MHHTALWLTDARLLAEFGLRPKLALQAVLPFRVVNTGTRFTDLWGQPITLDYPSIHHHDETLTGLGDAQLFVHGALALGDYRFGVRAGASLPTGRVVPDPYKLAEEGLSHQHIQFGTGTFDPVLSLDLAKPFSGWSLAGFAQAQLPLYRGRTGYQAGARVVGGLVGITGFGLTGPAFRLGVTLAHETAERWQGVVPTEDVNQGRTDLFAGPGMTIPFLQDWSMSVDVRARVFGYTVNAQLNMPVIVSVSIGRLLHLENGFDEAPVEASSTAGVTEAVSAGEATPLTNVEGKWTVFDFWAPWCDACRVLDGSLRSLAASDSSVAIRKVNIVDFDSPIALRELPGVSVLPHVRVVAPDGSVVLEESGPADKVLDDVKSTIEGGLVFTCPMHPEVRERREGECPKCGMRLSPVSSKLLP